MVTAVITKEPKELAFIRRVVFGLFPPVLALLLLVHTVVCVPRLSAKKTKT